MKMKNLFVLLAAITLVACSSNASKLPSSSLEGDSSSSSSSVETTSESSNTTTSTSNNTGTSSNNTGTSSNNTGTSSNHAGTSSNGGSSSSEPEDGVKKKTVTFLNGGFTNSSLDQPASRAQFVEWFNGSDNILDSITYTGYAQLNYIGNANDSWRFSTLILGSQTSEGTITFNFNVHVVSVKIVVQPYTKYISYNDTYNIDKSAKFYFNEEEHDLSVDANHSGDTEKVTLECFPKQNENKFKIANKEGGQRVFVHSFELTYWG